MLIGFILTNTVRLAKIFGVQSGKIQILLNHYINACPDINWQLIDTADEAYSDIDHNDWHAYHSIIQDYRCGLGLDKKGAYNIPLFIIGGDNVIPMPRLYPDMLVEEEQDYIPVDMLYCFDSDVEEDFVRMIQDKPYFAVGRLPITKGLTITHLSDYLENSAALISSGLPTRGVVMTTSESWAEASREIVQDIPSVSLSSSNVPIRDNMISCPLLDTRQQPMYEGYLHELRKADMWIFNLHGSDRLPDSSFYGDSRSSSQFPEAIQTAMLEKAAPAVFSTAACFGARYEHYPIESSMMLSAFVHGTMLYMGAGHYAMYNPKQLGRGAALLKYYTMYLYKGFPAGMALLKAKQDYYCDFHLTDNDETALYTVLEFNLFGCPILSVMPKLSMDYQPASRQAFSSAKLSITYRPKQAISLFRKQYKISGIDMYVKHSSNQQLVAAYQKIQSEIGHYFLVDNVELEQVYRLSENNCEVGYRFVYRQPASATQPLNVLYIFECDNSGNIVTIAGTV